MGIGSYGICNDEQEAVCIDCLDFNEWDYEDIQDNLLSILPKSFCDYSDDRKWDNDHLIIAENSLFSVQTIGHEHDVGLRVKIKDHLYEYDGYRDITGLAKHNLENTAKKIFDAMSDMYDLRVKTSGYTSTPYEKGLRL